MAVKFLNGIDVDGSMNIAASDVPNLDASKITSGTFSADRIPTGLYQPAGDYLDLETANTTFQPIGNYLTSVPSEYLTQTEGDARYLTSLPNHNHDTLYDAIGSADAVGQQLNERIDTEVFDAINSKQPAGNYFTDGDTVLNMANNDGLVYNDTNNTMYIKKDGTDYAIIDAGGGTITGTLTLSGGGTKISMNNGDITGVNQILINDPGEGIVWTNGSSGNMTLAIRDDASDNTLNLTGTGAALAINGLTVATQSWVSGQGYLTSLPSHNHDTLYDSLGSADAVATALNERIDTEVFDAIGAVAGDAAKGVTAYGWGNHAGLYLGATAKAADSNLLDGIDSSAFLRSNANDSASGNITFSGTITHTGNLAVQNGSPTISLLDTSAEHDFYIHVNSNNFYVLRNTNTAENLVGTGWDSPHPMMIESDTNSVYFFGNKLNSAAYAATSAFDSAGSADAVATALNERIDTEVFDAIGVVDAKAAKGETAYGWGNHASAGYLTSVPSALSVSSVAYGSGVTLSESTDRADLLMIKSSTSTWGGLQVSNTSNEIIFSLMGDGTTGGIYDDQNSDWLIQWTENAAVRLYYNAGEKLTTTSTGITVTGQVNATGGNSGNWNTAYGWGNHASAGYLTSIPSDYVRQGQDIVSGNIHPVGDRQQLLGLDSNRWQIVFCEILDSAGQHEKNLQNPAGETSVADYATGTVMVWENGKNVPCTTYANHMRMGIAVENVDSPMIQGAEPVLVTGTVVEGDYLVTSTTEGHAVAVSRDTVKQEQLWDCVIGKALEGGEGESHLIKTWVTI